MVFSVLQEMVLFTILDSSLLTVVKYKYFDFVLSDINDR